MTQDYKHTRSELETGIAELACWFHSTAGRYLLEMEQDRISRLLPDLFGYHILQIGGISHEHLLDNSRINHKLVTSAVNVPGTGKTPDLFCDNGQLPIASESIDVVVLPHVLEFESQPHQLLRETERILIGEGHLIVFGFSPVSLWSFWRLFLKWRQQLPWSSKTIGMTRLKDWLSLLDFEIIHCERFFFRPPFNNERLMQRLVFLEQLGHYCWPYFGSVYLLLAKKRVASLTPIRLQWQMRRHLIATGMIEPSA